MVSSNSNTIKKKIDSVEIALPCLSHYIHFLFQQQQTQKLRMSAIQFCKWLLTVLKLNLWQCPIVLPPCRQRVATSSASEGPAVLLQESHCFNYSRVITSINCNVFVNAASPKKKTYRKKTKRWENWNYILRNQPGDKLAALISMLTDSPSPARGAISHSSTENWKVGL